MSETDPFYSEEADGMSKRTQLEEYFSQSLEIDLLLRLCSDDEDTIYQIVDLLVDTCATNRKMLRIAGDDKPAEVVRSRFMKLNGGKCILQLRGVRPFMSDKYDLTQHPNYKYTSDYDPKNALDIEKFLNRKEKIHPDDTFVMVDADSLPPA